MTAEEVARFHVAVDAREGNSWIGDIRNALPWSRSCDVAAADSDVVEVYHHHDDAGCRSFPFVQDSRIESRA